MRVRAIYLGFIFTSVALANQHGGNVDVEDVSQSTPSQVSGSIPAVPKLRELPKPTESKSLRAIRSTSRKVTAAVPYNSPRRALASQAKIPASTTPGQVATSGALPVLRQPFSANFTSLVSDTLGRRPGSVSPSAAPGPSPVGYSFGNIYKEAFKGDGKAPAPAPAPPVLAPVSAIYNASPASEAKPAPAAPAAASSGGGGGGAPAAQKVAKKEKDENQNNNNDNNNQQNQNQNNNVQQQQPQLTVAQLEAAVTRQRANEIRANYLAAAAAFAKDPTAGKPPVLDAGQLDTLLRSGIDPRSLVPEGFQLQADGSLLPTPRPTVTPLLRPREDAPELEA